jgi:N6-adenosine-specific RNA methylase IME4
VIVEGKKYNLIYADPPWPYRHRKVGRWGGSGASDKYSMLTLEEIEALPVKALCCRNAVLFLWVTVPLMPEGLSVLSAWGFRYKTMLTWRKIMSQGMGFWFRGQCEHLLLGVRGRVKPFRIQRANFYQCRAARHSQKPDYFRQLVAEAAKASFSEPAMLELFARSRKDLFPDYEYEGWDVFGDQVNRSIELPD